MIVDVQVPVQGLTVTEATLVRWARQPGEAVAQGEALFEIETDKAVQEVESPEAGTVLAHLVGEGAVVPLGAVVAKLGTSPSDRLDDAAAPAQPPAAGGPAVAAMPPPGRPAAEPVSRPEARPSPRARRAAERLGIDLARVAPTGGRSTHIRERDVLAAAGAAAASPVGTVAPPALAVAPDRVRRITAERTAASFRDTPHFYLTREIDAEPLVALRETLVADLEAEAGVRLTVTDLLVKALALTLARLPGFNAQWRDGAVVPLETVDICLAVDTPQGLVVPVIREADRLTLVDLARQRVEIAGRARAGRSRAEDLVGGSFTLSNMGALDVDQFEAVINPPQSGILAVGTIKRRPFVRGEDLVACRTLFLSLSVDHRLVDGADAARFLAQLAALLGRPALLCVL